MPANWLGDMFVKFIGTIFFMILLIPAWLGFALLSLKFWAWLFNSGRAPQVFRRIRERFRGKNTASYGAYERFFHVIFGFLVMLFVIFTVGIIYSITK